MTQIVLNVPDISCEHCERTITKALTPVEGVRSVAVDIPARQVRVDYDESRVVPEQMKQILEAEDYPVASAEPSGRESSAAATAAVDPVCGMTVDTRSATQKSEHRGQTHYFCAPGCKRAFDAEPAKYLDPNYKASM